MEDLFLGMAYLGRSTIVGSRGHVRSRKLTLRSYGQFDIVSNSKIHSLLDVVSLVLKSQGQL